MNVKQLQYAIQLAEVLNFSQLAEQLKISQPALSKQIISLEQELGVRLFDRSSLPMTLTPAGECFIREAKELLLREDQLKRSMQAFRSGSRGRLVIGVSPFRSLYMIPPIVKKVRERFPGIQIQLHEASSDTLRKEVSEGKYDFAIINLPLDESVLDITPIQPDKLVLAVPNSLLERLPVRYALEGAEIRMEDCGDIPFIVVGQSQEMRILFDKLCASADFRPEIAMEVVGLNTAWTMCCAGIGATLLPLQFVNDSDFGDGISLFTIKNNAYVRQPAVVTRRGQYLPDYAAYAIGLLTDRKNQ